MCGAGACCWKEIGDRDQEECPSFSILTVLGISEMEIVFSWNIRKRVYVTEKPLVTSTKIMLQFYFILLHSKLKF